MTALAVQENEFDVALKDIEIMNKMCQQLMRTKHYQAMGEAGLFAIVQKAKALNINPLEALNGGLYYVQGKVGMSSEMMASLIRQAGHSIIKDKNSDSTVCILHGKRADNGDTWTVSFSMDDAKRAGLAKNMYDKYPGIMLYNRCMSMLARQLFPDVIKGAGYTHEELVEIKSKAPVVIEYITADQADEIYAILAECESEYVETVLAFIKKAPINADTLYQLPTSFYERVKSAAIRKREEAKARSEETIIESEEIAMEA